jgi:hypothetical protein
MIVSSAGSIPRLLSRHGSQRSTPKEYLLGVTWGKIGKDPWLKPLEE